MSKVFIMGGLLLGSTLGGYIPTLWGDSVFSISSIVGNFIGGVIGVWAGYKISQNFLD